MSFNLSIQIDPHAVLGVVPGAALHEIREAYRRKAKLHHPDAGGEEWAFRILSQSYEVLSTARVVQATQAEFRARPSRPPGAQAQAPPRDAPRSAGASFGAGTAAQTETIRPGVRDAAQDPTKVVDVEKLWVRFEVDHLWLLQDGSRDDRFLSCCLSIAWPEPELASRPGSIPDAEETLSKLRNVFEEVHISTPVINSRYKVEDDKFEGWLSYPSTQVAWNAFNKLHEALNAHGLSVKQWTRDLIIPREWH